MAAWRNGCPGGLSCAEACARDGRNVSGYGGPRTCLCADEMSAVIQNNNNTDYRVQYEIRGDPRPDGDPSKLGPCVYENWSDDPRLIAAFAAAGVLLVVVAFAGSRGWRFVTAKIAQVCQLPRQPATRRGRDLLAQPHRPLARDSTISDSAVVQCDDDNTGTAPSYTLDRALEITVQTPLLWECPGQNGLVSSGATVKNVGSGGKNWQTAMCSGQPMHSGRHIAELTILSEPAMVGLVSPDFDATSEPIAHYTPYGWALETKSGKRWHNERFSAWVGEQAVAQTCEGDVLRLQLDLDDGTLTVFNNDKRLGVLWTGLTPPLCWMCEVATGGEVQIIRGVDIDDDHIAP